MKFCVFVLNITFGVLITLSLFFLAPLIASFYAEPKLIDLTRVLALSFLLSSFGIIQYSLLSRDLLFRKTTISTIASTLASGIVGVGMALTGYGVWSLVGSRLAGITTRVGVLWVVSDWRPVGRFSMASVRSIWGFSFNLLGAQTYSTVVGNLSNILIGKYYSPETLGLYTRGFQLQQLPVSLLTSVIHKVAFPTFSKNQADKDLLNKQLRVAMKGAVFFISMICVFLYISAYPLILFLLGEKWVGAAKFLQILSIAGLFYPMNVLMTTLIQSVGRSDLFLRLEVIKKTIIIIVIFIAAQYSVEALAWSLVFTGAMAYAFNSYIASPIISYSGRQQIKDIIPIILFFILSGVMAYLLNLFLGIDHPFLEFFSIGVTFSFFSLALFYFARNKLFHKEWFFFIANTDQIKKRIPFFKHQS